MLGPRDSSSDDDDDDDQYWFGCDLIQFNNFLFGLIFLNHQVRHSGQWRRSGDLAIPARSLRHGPPHRERGLERNVRHPQSHCDVRIGPGGGGNEELAQIVKHDARPNGESDHVAPVQCLQFSASRYVGEMVSWKTSNSLNFRFRCRFWRDQLEQVDLVASSNGQLFGQRKQM